MNRLLFTFFCFFCWIQSAVSQLPVLGWAKVFDAYSADYSNGRTVGVDAQGNVFSAGFFENSLDFDPGPGLHMMTGGGPFNQGIYISKLDINGNFVWAKQIPTTISWSAIELKIDRAGNIYLAADLRNTADMDPGPGVFMMSPIGFRDAFVIKLNNDGNLIWAKKFGGPGDTGPQAFSIDLDPQDNVFIGGLFNNTVDFDPGPGTVNMTSTAHQQSYIVKLNYNGDYLWSKQFGNGSVTYANSFINDIKCDGFGNLLITGSFAGTCDFDPGSGVYNLISSAGSTGDGFIAKLDGNSNFIWAKSVGQSGGNNHYITPIGIDVDGMNNVVICGYFIGNFDFDPGTGVQNISSMSQDCFILKLNDQGNYIWAKTIGSVDGCTGNDLVTDFSGNVYIIGSFGNSVDFDPGPGVHIINSTHYGASAVVKLSPAGNFIYAAPFQSIDYGTSLFRRMVIDANLSIYVTGYASGISDFDPGPGIFPLAGGSESPFVLKLNPCPNRTSFSLDISTCNSYTLNNQVYDSSGTYVQTIPNSSGCDSVITLRLIINKKRTEQLKTICSGESFFAGGAIQFTSGTYIDTLHSVLGCDSIVTTRLTVNPSPDPDLGPDRSICRNSSITLTPGLFSNYLWQDNSTAPEFTATGTGLYWVKVINSYQCSATDSFRINTINNLPSGFLNKTDSVCSYKPVELIPASNYTGYQWSTGATSKTLQVQLPGIYRLAVPDANGCKGTDSTAVFAKQCINGVFFPSGFTPDNNGKNDLFKPLVYGRLVQFKLMVYNRWGAVVFQSNDPDRGWNGKVSGVLQDNAVFAWVCTYQLEGAASRIEKGTVMLIR